MRLIGRYAILWLIAWLPAQGIAEDARCADFLTKTFQSTHTADEIRACLQPGHAVNARDDAGNTALQLAAAHAPIAAVTRVLLRAGADPGLKNAANHTPMHMAAAHSNDPAQISTLAIRARR